MLAGTPSRTPTTLADLLPPELAARLDGLDVLSRKVFAGKLQGERRSKRRGRSVEFEEHREYVPGDDLRHIDWNVFARLDRFFVKIFQEEEDLGLHLVLDASPSMVAGNPTKLIAAARLAMALGYVGLVRNNRVGITIIGRPAQGGPGGGVKRLASVRGRKSVQRLALFLLQHAFAPAASAQPSLGERSAAGGDFTAALRAVASQREGKGVLVLLSDLLIPPAGGYQPGLRLLAAPSAGAGSSFDVYCLQILSPGELDPTKERQPLRAESGPPPAAPDDLETDLNGPLIGDLALTDVETGRVAEVTITAELIQRYRTAVKSYVAEASAFCAARGITHVLVPSDADVPGLVIDTLRRRGLLG